MRSYQYFEVRPCIETKGSTESFTTLDEYDRALHAVSVSGVAFETFWSLYGRCSVDGQFLAECIGDYETQADAMAVLSAILAPLARIVDLIESGCEQSAAIVAEDIINQSSNEERL